MASRAGNRILGWLVGVVAAGLGASCGDGKAPEASPGADAPIRIVVTIPPLGWAVNGLAPEGSQVTLIVPPGASAHGYELTPAQAAAIAKADLLVMVGLGMEPRVEAALIAHKNEERRVVRFADVVGGDAPAGDGHDHAHDGHDHGHDHAHGVGGSDPHAWLDPVLMGRFVEMLSEEMPVPGDDAEARRRLLQRAAEMQARCAAIDEAYRDALSRAAIRSIVTHHNAYAYLAARYGLTVGAVIQGGGDTDRGGGEGGGGGGGHGAEATPGAIAAAVRELKASGAGAVFVEPQLNDALARRVAEAAGVKVLTLDPLGDGDWPAMMRANLEALIEGLGIAEASGDESAGG